VCVCMGRGEEEEEDCICVIVTAWLVPVAPEMASVFVKSDPI